MESSTESHVILEMHFRALSPPYKLRGSVYRLVKKWRNQLSRPAWWCVWGICVHRPTSSTASKVPAREGILETKEDPGTALNCGKEWVELWNFSSAASFWFVASLCAKPRVLNSLKSKWNWRWLKRLLHFVNFTFFVHFFVSLLFSCTLFIFGFAKPFFSISPDGHGGETRNAPWRRQQELLQLQREL